MHPEDSPEKREEKQQEIPVAPDPLQKEAVEAHFEDEEKQIFEEEASRGPLNESSIAPKSVQEAAFDIATLQMSAIGEPLALLATFKSDPEGLRSVVLRNLEAEAKYREAQATFVAASADLKRAEARQIELNNQKREHDLEGQKRFNWLYAATLVAGALGLVFTLAHSILGLFGYTGWSLERSAFSLVTSLLLTRLREVNEALGALLAWLGNVMKR